MSKVICEREELVAVADAIREKSGTTDSMTLDGMAALIDGIESGGDTVVITTANEDGTQNIYIIDDGSIKSGRDLSAETVASGAVQTLTIVGTAVSLT